MRSDNHKRLVIPGPVEVRPEILDEQTRWMVGHRSTDAAALIERLEAKLKQVFFTQSHVLISGSSGTGLWEGASRCCIRDDQRVLHLVGGAFSERWAHISQVNGKQVDVIEVEWGQAHTPAMVEAALQAAAQPYDAIAIVHNETSTGVINPVRDIAALVRSLSPDTLIMVDSVSGILGAEIRADEWGLDVLLTSSQKAFALPPGLAFASVSDRTLERAQQIPNRGYYFDFVELAKSLEKNNTPSTPPISLMYAADKQLDDILAEGLDNRWARHLQMRDMTTGWALERGFDIFAEKGYWSPTVSAVANTRGISVDDMAKFMKERGYTMDKGYGKVKGTTFRIAHMGDMQPAEVQDILGHLNEFVGA